MKREGREREGTVPRVKSLQTTVKKRGLGKFTIGGRKQNSYRWLKRTDQLRKKIPRREAL